MIKDIEYASLLFDFYGELLAEQQKLVMSQYHEDNLSLSEIAENLKITRQGVHYALRHAEKTLVEYENKLRLVEKYLKNIKSKEEAKELTAKLINGDEKEKKAAEIRLYEVLDSFVE